MSIYCILHFCKIRCWSRDPLSHSNVSLFRCTNSFVFLWFSRTNGATAASFLSFIYYTQVHTHSHTHTHTQLVVRLLWMSDQPVAEAATCTTHNKQGTNIHALSGIRTSLMQLLTYSLEHMVSGIGWDVRYGRILRTCECLLSPVEHPWRLYHNTETNK